MYMIKLQKIISTILKIVNGSVIYYTLIFQEVLTHFILVS